LTSCAQGDDLDGERKKKKKKKEKKKKEERKNGQYTVVIAVPASCHQR